MKLFRSLIVASSLLGLGASAVVAAEAAASSQSCSTNCMMPCNWDMSMHRFYVGGGPVYSSNHKFNGWGGTGHVGYFFHKNHAVELELNYFGSEADQCLNGSFKNKALGYTKGNPISTTNQLNAKLEQWPLMLNYRYHGCLADFGCCDHDWMKRVLFNLGVGIGINFARTKTDICYSETSKTGGKTVTGSYSDHDSHTEFAAQIFGQMGYAITDNFSALVGLRAFFTEEFKFGDVRNKLDAEATSLVVDMGFNWRF